jgi:hypothetical protein
VNNRNLIIRLDGKDLDAGNSALLVYLLGGEVELVISERKGADAVVVLSREQARDLAQALTVALDARLGDDAR